MELSSSQRKTIRHQFDSFCKKVLREEYRDCVRKAKRRLQHEISFSGLSSKELEQLFIMDEYPSDNDYFRVLEYDIVVRDELISKALAALPEPKCYSAK